MLRKERVVKTGEDGSVTVTIREYDPLDGFPEDIFGPNTKELIKKEKEELERKESSGK